MSGARGNFAAAGATAAVLLLGLLSGCARASVRTETEAAEQGRGVLPGEQGAELATFALG